MFFRNLSIYRFPRTLQDLFTVSMADALSDLDRRLAENRLKPVGPLERSSAGFIPPLGRRTEALSHRSGDCIWLTLGTEEKILPAAVVNELLAHKLAEIEEREGRLCGGRQRKRLKDEILFDCLPKAFVRPGRVDAYFDLARGLLVVDTASASKAGAFVDELRAALGSFPAMPLATQSPVCTVLTSWVCDEGALPAGLGLGDEIELIEATDNGAVVRAKRQDLDSDEIDQHLQAGKLVSRLALTHQQHVSFLLCDDLVIRRLAFLDAAVESLENAERDSLAAELDARFTLMTLEVGRLFDLLSAELQLLSPDDAPGAGGGRSVEIRTEDGSGVRVDAQGITSLPADSASGANQGGKP